MISNMWKKISVQCAQDGETLVLDKHCNYTCPKCKTMLSLRSFEKMLEKVANDISQNELSDEVCVLTGEKFKDKYEPIYFTYLEHNLTTNEVVIGVDNQKKI